MKQNACILVKFLESSSSVNYNYLQSEFYKKLHSCDDLRDSQKFLKVYKIAQNLHPFISQVIKSINRNSLIEIIRDMIIYLLQFTQYMSETSSGKI